MNSKMKVLKFLVWFCFVVVVAAVVSIFIYLRLCACAIHSVDA